MGTRQDRRAAPDIELGADFLDIDSASDTGNAYAAQDRKSLRRDNESLIIRTSARGQGKHIAVMGTREFILAVCALTASSLPSFADLSEQTRWNEIFGLTTVIGIEAEITAADRDRLFLRLRLRWP